MMIGASLWAPLAAQAENLSSDSVPSGISRRLINGEHAKTLEERAFLTRTAWAEIASGRTPSDTVVKYLQSLDALAQHSDNAYERALVARAKAEAARVYAACDGKKASAWMASAERDLACFDDFLTKYGQKIEVHHRHEPAWIAGQPEAVAQAVLAWITLEGVSHDAQRREKISRFCEGLCGCLSYSAAKYPFGAHISRMTTQGKPRTYKMPDSEDMVAGASMIIEEQYCASALARAAHLLNNKSFLDSAEVEGKGLWAHLALMDKLPYDYAPRPENEVESALATAAVVENLIELKRATGKELYGDLAGCAAINASKYTSGAIPRAVRSWTRYLLANNGCSQWLEARDAQPALAEQVVELENGKAVEKSFRLHDIAYPGGTPGKLAVVGRDNTFWMRFDVDREESYYFHLCFLKSDAAGGLVSVKLRIDGDIIFDVNLDGATETPFVDVDLVAGPRLLRQGPHSVGVRFSGLLMRSPAWLDSILIEPAVQRRWVTMADGSSVLMLNSIAEQDIKVRLQELEKDQTGVEWTLYNGNGSLQTPELSQDRRRRMWLDMPARGAGKLVWKAGFPGQKAEE